MPAPHPRPAPPVCSELRHPRRPLAAYVQWLHLLRTIPTTEFHFSHVAFGICHKTPSRLTCAREDLDFISATEILQLSPCFILPAGCFVSFTSLHFQLSIWNGTNGPSGGFFPRVPCRHAAPLSAKLAVVGCRSSGGFGLLLSSFVRILPSANAHTKFPLFF